MKPETREAIKQAADAADKNGDLQMVAILYYVMGISGLGYEYEDELCDKLSAMATQCQEDLRWVPEFLEIKEGR